jgi:hypothetical protein
MSSLSHTLQPTASKHHSIVHVDGPAEIFSEEPQASTDDGLGCMRGFAVAMLFNIILASVAIASWQLWRILR